jgi:hypothetical protein
VRTIGRDAPPAAVAAGPAGERRPDLTKWFAVLGAAFLAVATYVWAAWILSGDATPTHPGPDPIPGYVKAFAWVYQASGVILLIGCIIYCVRKSRREGQLTLDAMIFFAWATAMWLDPATNNFIRPNLLYNSYLINFGSWAPHIPGWLSPNAHLLPEPIVAYIGLYGVPGVLVAMLGCWGMRVGRRRWPHMGKVGVFLCGFAVIGVFDLVLELFLIRAQMWSYPLAIRSLSVNAGTTFQFPVYESFLFGACWAATAALRHFRDDKGRTVVERGAVASSPNRKKATAVRLLAVTGFVHLTYLVYSMCFSWAAVYGGPYPQGYKSWMLNGMCGPGTEYVCQGPKVPIPIPDSGPTRSVGR